MELDETDKALVRSFLATNAAKRWLEYAKKNCPKLELAKVPIKNYNASLIIEKGWTGCADFLQSSVQETSVPEYGIRPIETVTD